jgi:hypothetical protein
MVRLLVIVANPESGLDGGSIWLERAVARDPIGTIRTIITRGGFDGRKSLRPGAKILDASFDPPGFRVRPHISGSRLDLVSEGRV